MRLLRLCGSIPARALICTSSLAGAAAGVSRFSNRLLLRLPRSSMASRCRRSCPTDTKTCWPPTRSRGLSPAFTPGENFLRWRLLDPRARHLHADWDAATAVLVAGLRELAGSDPEDPRLQALVDELSSSSERFRELWTRADVGYHGGIGHLRHPLVGDLYLHHYKLDIPHSGGQHVLIYHAERGSESARALDELRSLSLADERRID
jgi:hypothetical protein